MSEIFFETMSIPKPKYNLNINDLSHGAMTGRMLEQIEKLLLVEKPDFVLVYGDTNSTLAGTLAAVKLHIPIGHVEAGLRSFNRLMPEEINRVLSDQAADLLFTPTKNGAENLQHEGLPPERIFRCGDVMYDAALFFAELCEEQSDILKQHSLVPKGFALTTIHRAENCDDPRRLRAIFEGLQKVTAQLPVLLPLHPRTRHALKREKMLDEVGKHLRLIEPVGYLDMVMLEKNARLIATDSGGVQKEAYFHKVPCITLRTETEWVELVELGWNRLVDPGSPDEITKAILQAIKPAATEQYIYGEGNAAGKIVGEIIKWLKKLS